MILHILGSCSGTEPMPGRHHTSLCMETDEANYFFDAGENCSNTAHLSGIDLLKTKAIFISHNHFDHIGGLAGLFRNIKKMRYVAGREPEFNPIKLFMPDFEPFECIMKFLSCKSGKEGDLNCEIEKNEIKPGEIYRDKSIAVTAMQNCHAAGLSFSYKIEANGKTIVFSGDVKSPEELSPLLCGGCDILLCETGHHAVSDVCDFAEKNGAARLVLIHHGREILQNRPSVGEALINRKIPIDIACDGMKIPL